MGKLALHWKILYGLVVGVAIGLVLNRAWDAGTWASLGVDHPPAFLAGDPARVPVLPPGVLGAAQLDPGDPALAGLRPYQLSPDRLKWLGLETVRANQKAGIAAHAARVAGKLAGLVGDMFVRALKFIAVPIILLAMILAVNSLGDLRTLGRLGGKTLGIFLVTATLSVALGLGLVNLIQPGGDRFIPDDVRASLLAHSGDAGLAGTAKTISAWNLVRDIIPTNPFDALARGDMLQIVAMALSIGIGLSLLPRERSRPVLEFLDAINEVFISITRFIMRLAPIGVLCLIAPVVTSLGIEGLVSLGAYCLTVLLGLLLIQFGIYGALVRVFGGMRLGRFYKGIAPVQLVAFSSSSSAATLPVTIQAVRDRLGVPPEITSFVCALGAKFNMDGTALMQAIAAVFLSQLYGTDMTLAQQLSLVLTAVVAAIGTPGIPSGGMVMLVIVLQSVGVPAEGIAIILAVDRVLDMCRTVVNVTGDASTAVVVAASERRRAAKP